MAEPNTTLNQNELIVTCSIYIQYILYDNCCIKLCLINIMLWIMNTLQLLNSRVMSMLKNVTLGLRESHDSCFTLVVFTIYSMRIFGILLQWKVDWWWGRNVERCSKEVWRWFTQNQWCYKNEDNVRHFIFLIKAFLYNL